MTFSGLDNTGRLVEIVELPGHPFFVAGQFHPELRSRPTEPAPALPRLRRRRAGVPAGSLGDTPVASGIAAAG